MWRAGEYERTLRNKTIREVWRRECVGKMNTDDGRCRGTSARLPESARHENVLRKPQDIDTISSVVVHGLYARYLFGSYMTNELAYGMWSLI